MTESRSIMWGFVVQGLALAFSMTILDGGYVFNATTALSVVFWSFCIVILLRRYHCLTPGDKRFIAFGLIPILVVGVPAFIIVWRVRGAI
jgi:hypothetical protein